MRTLQNNLFSFFFLFSLFFVHTAQADELIRFNRNVIGFVDFNSSGSLLFISPDGTADWFTPGQPLKTKHYKITDPDCIPHSQNPMSMDGEHAGMTLASPFLVGLGWVCMIDENTDSINLVSKFSLPEGAYSIVYAGEDQAAMSDQSSTAGSSVYFLMNSKPEKGTGFLHLVSINKSTLNVTNEVFATNVPGYSGAMLFDAGNIWISTWPGKVYEITQQKFLEALHSKRPSNFLQIAQLALTNGMGMSLFMLDNSEDLLYYNDEYGSYTVNFSSKKMLSVSVPCLPVAGYGQEWLLLCNNTSLQTWHK